MEFEHYFLLVCAVSHHTKRLERNVSGLVICIHLQHKGVIDPVTFAGIIKIKNACVPLPTGIFLHTREDHEEKICPTFLSWSYFQFFCLPISRSVLSKVMETIFGLLMGLPR